MKKEKTDYLSILRAELVPALGCTEPIALAYAGALVRKHLIGEISTVSLLVSKNIIKNVKSVVVPNTGGLKGIAASVAAGIIAGNSDRQLEVIADLTPKDETRIKTFLRTHPIDIKANKSGDALDISIEARSKDHRALVRILGEHTNVVRIEKDAEVIFTKPILPPKKKKTAPMSIKEIYAFINEADIEKIAPIIERQITFNMAIAEEGIRAPYGARIGRILLKTYGRSTSNMAKAYAAAASDARMAGSPLPVIITSGSGNQGITASIPVIIYARELKVDKEKMIRAVTLADLVTLHLKSGIGLLSAYCGATSAGVGAAAGIAYLYQNDLNIIEQTIINALVINSGLICDGAKPSCAAKVASSIEAGLLGMEMALNKQAFLKGEGIVSTDVEKTIKNVNDLVQKGMRLTDEKIVELMSRRC